MHSSAGFLRRWLFFTFNKKVPDDRKIENFAKEIEANEREVIAAWAVGVMPEFNKVRRYTEPSSHLEMYEVMANATNTVRFFFDLPRSGSAGKGCAYEPERNDYHREGLARRILVFILDDGSCPACYLDVIQADDGWIENGARIRANSNQKSEDGSPGDCRQVDHTCDLRGEWVAVDADFWRPMVDDYWNERRARYGEDP